MKTPKRILAFRREFPQLKGLIYFNHGACSVLPASVLQASVEGVKLSSDYSISPAAKARCIEIRNETRRLAAELIGARPRNIAFVANTSTALSLISLAIPWKKGDNVVTAAVENPATIVPWQNLRHLGVEVRYLHADQDDLLDLDALPKLLDRHTRLVALSLVGYATGQRLDVARLVRLCRKRGILVSIDGVQGLGAVPVDVKSWGVNFLSAGAQKWLIGPRHIGILYADDHALRLTRSPIVAEGNVADIAAEEEQPTRGVPRLRLNEDALKFEVVPYGNFPGLCGLHQTLHHIRAVGAPALYERLHKLTDELVDGLNRLDGRVISPRGANEWSGIVSFAPNTVPARELVADLRRKNVIVSLRKGRVRICPHYYNTSSEIRAFLAAFQSAGVHLRR